MEKEYMYENGIVTIIVPDNHDCKKIRKATEEFMRHVVELEIKENQNGNKHKTGDIKEKSILDK